MGQICGKEKKPVVQSESRRELNIKEPSNDDSVLFFGDGHPDIPSVMVTDLATKYLDKVEEEDDNIDPSFTVVEKPDVADIANNVIWGGEEKWIKGEWK